MSTSPRMYSKRFLVYRFLVSMSHYFFSVDEEHQRFPVVSSV
jgi:hypothetical protein